MNKVICVSGRIASGKSTFCVALQKAVPKSIVRSFGDVVRKHARRDGVEPVRANLQEVGSRLVAGGWPSFVDELVLDVPDEVSVLIVDGVRHVEPITELHRRYPSATFHIVFLDIDDLEL